MKKFLVLGCLFSSVLSANSLISFDTKIEDGKGIVTVKNTSGMTIACDYKVKWSTSLLDHHFSWGNVKIEDETSVTIIIEDDRGLPVRKLAPKFACDQY